MMPPWVDFYPYLPYDTIFNEETFREESVMITRVLFFDGEEFIDLPEDFGVYDNMDDNWLSWGFLSIHPSL